MLKLFFSAVLLAIYLGAGSAVAQEPVLLLPYFDSNGENGVYLAWSEDGREFHAVNSNEAIFTPPAWKNQSLTRDPSIVYHDGRFHMVWTSNWKGEVFGYASSPDLKSWSEPLMIEPWRGEGEKPNNVWAPEICWDHVADEFKVVWSSTLPSELADGDGNDDRHGGDHRMYYLTTTDFQQFSDPQPIFEGRDEDLIDAHLVFDAEGDRWVMNYKKEVSAARGGKNIRLAFSPPEITPRSFSDAGGPIVGQGTSISPMNAEGSSLVPWRGEWLLYWDSYSNRHYSMASSSDLQEWSDESDQLRMPVRHPRHGTVFIADRENIGWELTKSSDE
ncbi:Glycosyl hydrolases family 43 [Pseudobythopirellula maris]|uniref:Glycosyl hydrolases family 43 n=1 Tax=Pseudobythopirellula maris TaxID=2527991 RepID=A0A5C5ZSP2_9BACT|nr:glycoside hydrolase family 43 protein [Pseudobythopirellula maris]TWT89791.1 Glycosyl hydrolases family 43 [Pseudobythopirellula maris]